MWSHHIDESMTDVDHTLDNTVEKEEEKRRRKEEEEENNLKFQAEVKSMFDEMTAYITGTKVSGFDKNNIYDDKGVQIVVRLINHYVNHADKVVDMSKAEKDLKCIEVPYGIISKWSTGVKGAQDCVKAEHAIVLECIGNKTVEGLLEKAVIARKNTVGKTFKTSSDLESEWNQAASEVEETS